MNCDISVFIKFAFDSFVNEFVSNLRLHGRIGRGGGGEKGAAPPPKKNLANLDFLGRKRNLDKANCKRTFHVCVRVVFFRRGIFSILN